MDQKLKKHLDSVLIYTKQRSKINNSKLLNAKAVYYHHFNDIKIGNSIGIVLNHLNIQHNLPLFFE